MRNRIFFLLLTCILFFVVNAQNTEVTVRVKFATEPTYASSSFAGLKYGKHCFYNIEVDDNSIYFKDLMNYFQGGLVSIDGQTYPGKFFTDGCGNNVPYKASIAINVRSHHNPPDQVDGDLIMETGNPNNIEISDLIRAVQTECYPAPHGYYHNMEGYYVKNNFTQSKNISECANYIWQKTQFMPRVFITPNADGGYNPYLETQGYFGNSSGNVTDGYPQSPTLANIWATGISDASEAGTGSFRAYLRDFLDSWTDQTELDKFKGYITALKNASTATTNKFRRIGTHGFGGSNWPNFKLFIEHIESTSQDAIWVTTLQEALEYLETKRKLIKSETLQGDELIIQLNYSDIPLVNVHRDISLQINSDVSIQSVTVTGAQRSTYNLNTGLINIFNKRTTGTTSVLPLKLVYFTSRKGNSGNVLQWQTTAEQQVQHFEIESSLDGVQFTKRGQLLAKAQPSNTYSFEDRQSVNQNGVYYRLKMVNVIGTYEYSKVILLKESTEVFSAIVAPNPVTGQINLLVESNKNQKATVTVLNEAGHAVLIQNLHLLKGSSIYSLSYLKLPKGYYNLKVLNSDGQTKTMKFISL